MNIQAFLLCDAATDTMGRMNILGSFDTIRARQAPVVHPQCALAARIRFERIERGEHQLRVSIADEDGQSVVPSLDTKLNVNFPDQYASYAYNIVLNLQRMKFERTGEYTIDLALDGRQESSLPLYVREVSPEQQQQWPAPRPPE